MLGAFVLIGNHGESSVCSQLSLRSTIFAKAPRTQPKIYILQVKSQKLSIHLILQPTITIAELKQEAFDALTSDVAEPLTRMAGAPRDPGDDRMDEDFDFNTLPMDTGLPKTEEDVVPRVTSLQDFELCKAVKEKGKTTGEFQVLEANDMELKMSGLSGWEVLFVQFRDKKSGEWICIGFEMILFFFGDNFIDCIPLRIGIYSNILADSILVNFSRSSLASKIYLTAYR